MEKKLSYLTPTVKTFTFETIAVIAGSWTSGSLDGDPTDIYDEEL